MSDEISVYCLEESEIPSRDQMRRNSLLSSAGKQLKGNSLDTESAVRPSVLRSSPLGFALRASIVNYQGGLLR